LRVDDVVSFLDGKPAATLTLEQLLQALRVPGQERVIKVLRGKAYIEVKVTPR
jgi:hypothetical protein